MLNRGASDSVTLRKSQSFQVRRISDVIGHLATPSAVQVGARRTAITCGHDHFTYAQLWDRCRRLAGSAPGAWSATGRSCRRHRPELPPIPRAVSDRSRCRDGDRAVERASYRRPSCGTRSRIRAQRSCSALATSAISATRPSLEVVDFEHGYDQMLADAECVDLPDTIEEATLAGLFYTGGTTGASKGVMLTHRNLIANASTSVCAGRSRLTRQWLIAAPLFHAAGSIAVLATVWNGGHQVDPAELRRRRRSRSHRAPPRHVDAGRPDDAGCHDRRAVARPPRRFHPHTSQPRRLADARPKRCGARTRAFPTRSSSTCTAPPRRRRSRPCLPHEELMLDELALARADSPRSASTSASWTTRAPGARRRGRRGRGPRRQRDGGLLEQARADGRRIRRRLATAPATSATRTTRATCSSSTAPRT